MAAVKPHTSDIYTRGILGINDSEKSHFRELS